MFACHEGTVAAFKNGHDSLEGADGDSAPGALEPLVVVHPARDHAEAPAFIGMEAVGGAQQPRQNQCRYNFPACAHRHLPIFDFQSSGIIYARDRASQSWRLACHLTGAPLRTIREGKKAGASLLRSVPGLDRRGAFARTPQMPVEQGAKNAEQDPENRIRH